MDDDVMIILTTLTIFILKLCYPQYDWAGLRKRVFFWWAMNCLFAFALVYTEWFGLSFLVSSFLLIFMLL
jgi:predicted CDP-diglyceride synthetase/phosphatidate cytidylyltransferase